MPRETQRAGPEGRRDREQTRELSSAEGAVPRGSAARVLWLQGGAGHRAVAAQLARAPAATGPPAASPEGPPAPSPAARVVDAPPPQKGVEAGEKLSNVDVGSEARQVTLTFLIGRDFHLKGRDAAAIDWLHEPGVTIKAAQGPVPKPVIEAAMAAMNVRSHGKDLVEIAVAPQAGISHEGTPSVGGRLQVEVARTWMTARSARWWRPRSLPPSLAPSSARRSSTSWSPRCGRPRDLQRSTRCTSARWTKRRSRPDWSVPSPARPTSSSRPSPR